MADLNHSSNTPRRQFHCPRCRPSNIESGRLPDVTRTVPPRRKGAPTWTPVRPQQALPDLVRPAARKRCCGLLLSAHGVAIRWLVLAIGALGLLCSVVGTALGLLKATGKEHITVALLLIGLGIVLVSMSGVAWRLTSRESPSCAAMFGLRSTRTDRRDRRFVPRVPGRAHPFSAMLYPDICLRPPPPSYQASMQQYRLRLLLTDGQVPPPPAYYRAPDYPPRFPSSEYSRPPSYRSRPSPNVDRSNEHHHQIEEVVAQV